MTRRARRLAVLPVLLLAVACSSSSSGGSSSVPPTASPSAAVDPSAVDGSLDAVLQGLTAATSISASTGVVGAASRLQRASSALSAASTQIAQLTGVPSTVVTPVAAGLKRISGLLGQAGDCLHDQATAKAPDPKACIGPLQQAEQQDASLAHGLISLAAYGSRSPKIFEADLVAALRGR